CWAIPKRGSAAADRALCFPLRSAACAWVPFWGGPAASNCSWLPSCRGRQLYRSFQLFAQERHIQIAAALHPFLVLLGRHCPDQTQTTGFIGKDPHHQGAPLDLLIETLQHVGALEMFVVAQGQLVVSPGFLNVA